MIPNMHEVKGQPVYNLRELFWVRYREWAEEHKEEIQAEQDRIIFNVLTGKGEVNCNTGSAETI